MGPWEPRILEYIPDVGPWEPRILKCILDAGPWESRILKGILDVGPWKPRILKCILDAGPWEPRILKCILDAGPWEPRILNCILDAGPWGSWTLIFLPWHMSDPWQHVKNYTLHLRTFATHQARDRGPGSARRQTSDHQHWYRVITDFLISTETGQPAVDETPEININASRDQHQ